MGMVIDVPLNTAIADLDQVLRLLLRRELGRHGFEGVDIAFDAPSRDWSGKLTNPTVNLFLYDLREALEQRETGGGSARNGDAVVDQRPPMRLELTYAVTAWTKAVEDEHRLLSQVLAILFSYRQFPTDIVESTPDGGSRLRDIQTVVAEAREDKSDFWTAVGGTYKVSMDYVVRMSVESGAMFVRGPEVRSQTLRTRMIDAPAYAMVEMHRFGGTVSTGAGEPVANAWVALPESGRWSVTDREGRFRFDGIQPGPHRIIARTADGEEAQLTATIPGEPADLVIGAKKAKK